MKPFYRAHCIQPPLWRRWSNHRAARKVAVDEFARYGEDQVRLEKRVRRRIEVWKCQIVGRIGQRSVADPPSPAPGFHRALAQVERLLPAYRDRAVFMRYVPPKALTGAWIPYFEIFPSVLRPDDDPLWDLKLPASAGAFVETRTTFSKWGRAHGSADRTGQPNRGLRSLYGMLCAEHHPQRSRPRPLCPPCLRRLRRRLSPRQRTGVRDP
jgi:hypothetical protein